MGKHPATVVAACAALVALSCSGCSSAAGTTGETSCAGLVRADGRDYMEPGTFLTRMPVGTHEGLAAQRLGCQDGRTADESVTARSIPGFATSAVILADESLQVPTTLDVPAVPTAMARLTQPIACRQDIRVVRGTALFSGGRTAIRTTDARLRTSRDEWVQFVVIDGAAAPNRSTWPQRFGAFDHQDVTVQLTCSPYGNWGVTSIERA